jgi:tetraacyldisaccharide 4'-kinase
MMLFKPKFWDKKIGLFSTLLFPFSLITIFIVFLKKKLINKYTFKTPVICIGNIYIGGTGKTPASILFANEITKLHRKPVIIRKYYKSHYDEHELIKNNFKDFILSKNRFEAIKKVDKSEFDVVILDDGLQDYKIKKNLSIVCFNENQLIGNGLVLPSGPLRENLSALKDVEVVLINGKKNKSFEEKIYNINRNLKIFYSYYKPLNLEDFKSKKLFALAGIGNPNNFFRIIEENNLEIEKKFIFPDHYKFSKSEIQNIIQEAESKNAEIIMTEKDYFKIRDFNLKKLNFLKVSLKIQNKEELIGIIEKSI